MESGSEPVGVNIPGLGKVTREGPQKSITGQGVLDQLLKDVPQLRESERHGSMDERVDKALEGPTVSPAMTPEEGYAAVPETLSDTDALRHENDILYVTNWALEHGGVTSMSGFVRWMHAQMAQASRSGVMEKPHPAAPAVPEVETLAKYLRIIGRAQRISDA